MKFSLFALAVVSLSGAEAISIKQESKESSTVSAQAFAQQLSALESSVAENQKELSKMKSFWSSLGLWSMNWLSLLSLTAWKSMEHISWRLHCILINFSWLTKFFMTVRNEFYVMKMLGFFFEKIKQQSNYNKFCAI